MLATVYCLCVDCLVVCFDIDCWLLSIVHVLVAL